MNIGLRFDRSQAPKLRDLSVRVRAADLRAGQRVELYDKAADAAEKGEPLIVACTKPEEALRMAAIFTVLGIETPAIEALPD